MHQKQKLRIYKYMLLIGIASWWNVLGMFVWGTRVSGKHFYLFFGRLPSAPGYRYSLLLRKELKHALYPCRGGIVWDLAPFIRWVLRGKPEHYRTKFSKKTKYPVDIWERYPRKRKERLQWDLARYHSLSLKREAVSSIGPSVEKMSCGHF